MFSFFFPKLGPDAVCRFLGRHRGRKSYSGRTPRYRIGCSKGTDSGKWMSHGHATIKMFSSFGCALCIVAKGTVLKEKDTAQYTCACFEAIKEKRKRLSIFRRNYSLPSWGHYSFSFAIEESCSMSHSFFAFRERRKGMRDFFLGIVPF